MQTHPSLNELVEAVKHFIDETAAPNLEGHASFHARIASNVLSIVLRELEQGKAAATQESQQLAALLNTSPEEDLQALTRQLCDEISSGKITMETPGLLAYLKSTAIAQLNIDQPRYSGLKTARETLE